MKKEWNGTADLGLVHLWCYIIFFQGITMGENWTKDTQDLSTLFLIIACESTMISN